VVCAESTKDFVFAVDEAQDVGGAFAWIRAVDARKRVDCLDTRKPPIGIHPAKEQLIEASLEFVRQWHCKGRA
jgi:hypothetical protein